MASGGDKKWIDVQKKTFTNWCNDRLKGTGETINELYNDFEDGVKMIKLLERLSKKKVTNKYHKVPKLPMHKSENLTMCFDFMLKKEKIHLVNIGPKDITERNSKLILGLIWHLILRYQILGGTDDVGKGASRKTKPPSAKKLLLNWLQAAMPENMPVGNVNSDWNDGHRLATLVDTVKPGVVPKDDPSWPKDALPMTEKTMDIAEKELEIPKIIDPIDLCVPKPDELSVMTYLSYFCSGDDSPGYNSLLEWVRSKIPEYNIQNFTDDWRDGRALSALVNAVSEGSIPDHASLDPNNGTENVRKAMDTADENLEGLRRNITPEEFSHKRTDPLAMMGYLEWYRKARPKEAINAVGPGISGSTVGAETYFHIKGNVAKGALKIKVTDPEGSIVPLHETPSDVPNFHTYRYTPTKAGRHTVNIDKEGVPINGSPFFPNHTDKSSPEKCFAKGDGLTKAQVSVPATFEVDCSKGGPGNLKVDIKSPSGIDVPATLSGGKKYGVNFTPNEVGPHNITMLYENKQIQGSPSTCVVTDPSKVVVEGDGLHNGTTRIPSNFTIKTEGAGPGKPVVKVSGPTRDVPCDVKEEDDHVYACSFTPYEAGPHKIDVQFADHPAPSSPFECQVKDPCDPSKVVLREVPQGNLKVGHPYHLVADATEAGEGVVTADIKTPTETTPCSIQEAPSKVYNVRFTPKHPGKQECEVLFAGQQVPHSPLPFNVIDPAGTVVTPPTPSSDLGVHVTEEPLVYQIKSPDDSERITSRAVGRRTGQEPPVTVATQGDNKHTATLTAPAPDDYDVHIYYGADAVPGSPFFLHVEDQPHPERVRCGSPIPGDPVLQEADISEAGAGKLTAEVKGDRAGPVNCTVSDSGPGKQKMSFRPPIPDVYWISPYWNKTPVPRAPFRVSTIPTDSSKIKVDGPHYPNMASGPVNLTCDSTEAGDGELTAKCGSKKFGDVPVRVTETDKGKHDVRFDPPGKDQYRLSVYWDQSHVPQSPFDIDLNPPDASKVSVDGPYPPSEGLGPVRSVIDCSEAGDGELQVAAAGRRTGPTDVTLREKSPAVYDASFNSSEPDTYDVDVKFENQHVPGSPFTVQTQLNEDLVQMEPVEDVESSYNPLPDWYQGEGDTSEPKLASEIAEYYVGQSFTLEVGKEEEGIPGQLSGSCVGDTAGAIPVEVVTYPNGSGSLKIDPRVPDLYTLTVNMGDDLVPPSPLKIRYLPPPPDASKVRLYNLPPAGEKLVARNDINYNVDAKNAGTGNLTVKSDSPSDAKHNSLLQVNSKSDGDFTISYTPGVAGTHKNYIYWSGTEIPDSPVVFEVEAREIPSFPYGKPVNMDFVFPGVKNKDLSGHVIYQPTGKKTKLSIDKVKDEPDKCKVSFKPQDPGIYEIHVFNRKVPVKGSPFEVRVLEPPRPDRVVVNGLDSVKCQVDDTVRFDVDATKAGNGELTVTADGPADDGEISKLNIYDNKNNTFDGTYVPRTKGNHLIHVKWADQPVPGSPFNVQAGTEVSKGLTILEVGSPLDISLTDTTNKDVVATAVGDETGPAHVTVQENDDHTHSVRFQPLYADDYTLEVLIDNEHIDGSPFRVMALNRHTVFGDTEAIGRPAEVEVDRPVNYVLKTGPLNSTPKFHVTGPSGPVDSSVTETEDGRFITHFKPKEEGQYLVHGTDGGKPLKGSPYMVIAKDMAKSDPSKCFILPADKETMAVPYEFNQPCSFRVSTVNAGPGTLNVTSRGPGKADVRITDNHDGIYSVQFQPVEPGKYQVDVTWDEASISGSPCNVVFKGERKSRVLTGLDLSNVPFRVGRPHKFKIHTDEVGDGDFEVNCDPPSHAQVTIKDLGNQTYHVTILPKEPGLHQLAVTHSDQHIMGSPFAVTFEQRGDASKCHLLEEEEDREHQLGNSVSFLVTTKDAGPGTLTAKVDNLREKTSMTPGIEKLDETTYRVTFDPGEGTEYMMNIFYDENPIKGSPFKLTFDDKPDASQCRAEGEGLVTAQQDKEAAFTVFTENVNAELTVIIEGDYEKVNPVIVKGEEGHYNVTYTPHHLGDYRIDVLWNDDHIPGSPFKARSYKHSDPSNIKLDRSSIKDVMMGKDFSFSVDAREAGQEGELTVFAHGPNQVVEGQITDNGDATYSATFDPPEPGKYMVHVRWDGQHIPGSPFKMKVSNPPMPEKVYAHGVGLQDGVAGQEGNFLVETKDAGAGTLAVRVHGPKGAFKINMKRDPSNDRSINVRYDPTLPGEYTVDITWSEVHVPGSPFKVYMRSPEEAEKWAMEQEQEEQ